LDEVVSNFSTNKEIVLYIKKLESHLDKVNTNFFGIDFWPVIRLQISFSLVQKNQTLNKPKKFSSKDISYSSFFYNSRVKKPRQLFVTHDNYLIEIEGQKYDRVMEKLIQDCDSPMILNLANNSIYSSHSGKPYMNITIQLFFIKALSYLTALLLRLVWSQQLSKLVQLQTRYKISSKPIVDKLSMSIRICYVWFLSKYILLFFKKHCINAVYQGMYYDNFGLASGLASDILEISNNCVQHGGQSKNNPAFGSWFFGSSRGSQFLPNNFLCWDEYSTKGISAWSKETDKHNYEIIGYSWMDIWKNKLSKNFEPISFTNKDTSIILVTLQPSVELKDSFLYDFILTSESQYNWLIRLHPQQESKEFIQVLEKQFQHQDNIYIKSSKEPLPHLLINSNFHVTFFSSSVYEAKYCNVKSIVVDNRGLDYFPDLIENGDILLANDRNHLEKILNNFS
tara:strand:+ start:27097 stop:28455 length:1359 start_codon:yes stop_codon:yes gene_type:complete